MGNQNANAADDEATPLTQKAFLKFTNAEKESAGFFVIYALIFIYAFNYWCTVPVEPFLVKQDTGASNTTYSCMRSLYSLVQLLGSYAAGHAADKYGVSGIKIGMLLGFFGNGFHDFLWGIASKPSRVGAESLLPDQAARRTLIWIAIPFQSMCQTMLLSEVYLAGWLKQAGADENEKARNFGRVRAGYGIGIILGSLVGGYGPDLLDRGGVYFLSSSISFIGLIIAMFVLKLKYIKENKLGEEDQNAGTGCTSQLAQISPNTKCIILLWGLLSAPAAGWSTTKDMGFASKNSLNLTEKNLGIFTTVFAACYFIANIFLVESSVAKSGSGAWGVLKYGAIAQTILIFLLGLADLGWLTENGGLLSNPTYTFIYMVLLSIPYNLNISLMNTAVVTVISNHASPSVYGTAMAAMYIFEFVAGFIPTGVCGMIFDFAERDGLGKAINGMTLCGTVWASVSLIGVIAVFVTDLSGAEYGSVEQAINATEEEDPEK